MLTPSCVAVPLVIPPSTDTTLKVGAAVTSGRNRVMNDCMRAGSENMVLCPALDNGETRYLPQGRSAVRIRSDTLLQQQSSPQPWAGWWEYHRYLAGTPDPSRNGRKMAAQSVASSFVV